MMRISPALVALCQWHYLLAYVHSATTAQRINTDKENLNTVNKSLEFVNIIRDDLRRNNDDYELLEGENQLANSAPLADSAKSSHPVHPVHPAYPVLPGHPTPPQPYRNIISPPVPRLQPANPPPARSARPPRPPARLLHSPGRAAPLRRSDTRKGEADLNQTTAINTQFRSYTRSKQYKSVRHNKLKRLLNKDKINMRQEDLVEAEDQTAAEEPPQVGDQPAADQPEAEDQPQTKGQPEAEGTTTSSPPATEPTTRSSPPPTTPEHTPPPSPLTHALTTRRHPFRPHQEMGEPGPILRNRKDHSPSPEQLDMAAARNPEITRIRIKVLLSFNPNPPNAGRLCQRSLLNAEGPTYDKRGHVLQPPHRPRSARGRKFRQTRAPSLVLPRCCNCCKKSVLGCQ